MWTSDWPSEDGKYLYALIGDDPSLWESGYYGSPRNCRAYNYEGVMYVIFEEKKCAVAHIHDFSYGKPVRMQPRTIYFYRISNIKFPLTRDEYFDMMVLGKERTNV
jgi:hypothetical protein